MSTLSFVAKALRDTGAQISHLEREISAHPNEKGLLVNLGALQKRLANLEKQFADLSSRNFLDICDYRLVPGLGDSYPISAVGSVLVAFQSMVTVFLDAIKSGPKLRARIAADVASLSSMNFAYTFDGSLGFTLTVPNDRLLAVSSDLDLAIENAFQLANSRETSDIATLATKVGIAAVRSAYTWTKAHAKHQMSADINWKRGSEIRNHTFLEISQLEKVSALIEQTSDVTEERVTLPGTLTAIDQSHRTFGFLPVNGSEISGKIAESIGFSPPFSVPSPAIVSLIKRTRVHFSIDKEEVTWEMIERQPEVALRLPGQTDQIA